MSIEREQASTAFKTMPHFTVFGGARLAAQPEKESFHTPFGTARSKESFDSLEPREVKAVEIGNPPEPEIGVLKGEFQVDERLGSDSWYAGEDHSRGSFRDTLTGGDRPMNVWTNDSATFFEGRCVGDYDTNDAVFRMRENIDWTAANGGPGSGYLTSKNASQSNDYVDKDVDGFMKLGDIKGELQTTDLRSDNRFVIERFEAAAGMNSFGESLNPVLELAGTASHGGSTFMTGQFDMPTNNIASNAGPGAQSF